jgi:hypothetical protein
LGSRIIVFGAPAHIVREVHVTRQAKEDPAARIALRAEILEWLAKERKSQFGAA